MLYTALYTRKFAIHRNVIQMQRKKKDDIITQEKVTIFQMRTKATSLRLRQHLYQKLKADSADLCPDTDITSEAPELPAHTVPLRQKGLT